MTTRYDELEKRLEQFGLGRAVALEYGIRQTTTEALAAIRELRAALTERTAYAIAADLKMGALTIAKGALLAELDEASPFRKCDRCGQTFRMHQLIYEEGDELECWPCNDRENKRQCAEFKDSKP